MTSAHLAEIRRMVRLATTYDFRLLVNELLDALDAVTPRWHDGEPPVPSSRGLTGPAVWAVWRESHERPVLTYRLTVDDTVVFLNSLGQWQPWSTPQAARWAPTCRPEM